MAISILHLSILSFRRIGHFFANYNDEFSVLNCTNKSRRKQMTGIFALLQQSKERCQSLQICLPNLSIDGSDKFNTFFTFQKRKNVQIELGVLQIKCYKLPS